MFLKFLIENLSLFYSPKIEEEKHSQKLYRSALATRLLPGLVSLFSNCRIPLKRRRKLTF